MGAIQRLIGRDFDVRPVVLYPGWEVEAPPKILKVSVLVMNHERLSEFVLARGAVLSDTEIETVTKHLERHTARHAI